MNSNPAAAVEAMTGALEGYARLNIGACIEVVGGDAACAAKYDAYTQCTETACSPCADGATYNACNSAAGAGVCASYWDAAESCMTPIWSDIQRCYMGGWEERYYYHVSNICGYTANSTTCSPYLPDPASVVFSIPATGSHQNKCNAGQVSAAYTACMATTATNATCAAFYNANKDCYDCVFPDAESDTARGSTYTVYAGDYALSFLNAPACLEFNGATDCADKYQALTECTRLACAPNCPVTDNASYDAFNACETSAETTICAGIASAVDTCWTALPDATKTACSYSTFEEGFNKLGVLFCGP